MRDCRTGSDSNSASGAGLRVSGNLELTNVSLRGNLVRGINARGGAAQVGGDATIVRSRIVANAAHVSATAATTSATGGGLQVGGLLTLTDSTIAGNTATTAGATGANATAGGGGLWISGGRLTITGSTISGNRSSGQGGGIVVNNFDNHPGQLLAQLVNSTVSGNVAASGLGGGMLSFSVPLRIQNSTLAFNASGEGAGGLLVLGSGVALEMQSTLAASNGVGGDIGAQNVIVASGANNLVRNTFQITMPSGTLNSDPLLGGLYAHGGLTRTHAAGTGSPILDTGNNVAGVAFDQRGTGFPRAAGPVDIGAFERQTLGDGRDGLYQDGFGD